MKIYDNIQEIVKDDMVTTISKGSKVSIAAACFSMYAYKELKKQLDSVDEFRFIFTSPTFTKEKASKESANFTFHASRVKPACMEQNMKLSYVTK